VVGILTIHFFLKLIDKISFQYFFYYRFILGATILVLVAFNKMS
jgi:undecaprenyl pyrophosphate phosphatase UppP